MLSVRQRSQKAQSAMELVCGAIVLVPLVLFCIDASTVYMGQSMNSSICRDAARAAANGPPSSMSADYSPQKRAELVVRKMQKAEGAIRMNPNVVCTEHVSRVPTMPFGGMVEGTVDVKTSVDVYPPFIIKFCVPKGAVKLSASQTFPFTYVMAGAYGSGAGESLRLPSPVGDHAPPNQQTSPGGSMEGGPVHAAGMPPEPPPPKGGK